MIPISTSDGVIRDEQAQPVYTQWRRALESVEVAAGAAIFEAIGHDALAPIEAALHDCREIIELHEREEPHGGANDGHVHG